MEIRFLGATGTVTGSKYLLKIGNHQVLVDCGLFQGLKMLRERNWQPLPTDPAKIDGVILTHAHIDHSGYLPRLMKDGFTGPIYASKATYELCKILLPDSGHLQEEDAKFANLFGYARHKPALPLYTAADAELTLKQFRTVEWGRPYRIHEDLVATWSHAGHILGAAMVMCQAEGMQILFSGDLGRQHDAMMNPPATMQYADYLILESTYGDRLHDTADPQVMLAEVINQTAKRGGSVLIPAFAVGRAQNILYYLYALRQQNKIPPIPVYLDSPMAISAAKVLRQFHKEQKLDAKLCIDICNMPTYVNTLVESQAIHGNAMPKVIISASGMATGGRVLGHLKMMAPDPRNTILLAGFQAADTRGEKLLKGVAELKIHGQNVPVRAKVASLTNTSAHADYEEIFTWLRGFVKPPRHVFITHGEPEAAASLKHKIETEFGWSCSVPEYGETVYL